MDPMNSMIRQKRHDIGRWELRSVGVQHATGEEGRNSSIKNEEAGPKRKQRPVLDVSSGKVKSDAIRNNTA